MPCRAARLGPYENSRPPIRPVPQLANPYNQLVHLNHRAVRSETSTAGASLAADSEKGGNPHGSTEVERAHKDALQLEIAQQVEVEHAVEVARHEIERSSLREEVR